MTTTDFRRTSERGLTLLEMMVVLLVSGMAIALGFQSLGQWRRANVAMSHVGSAVQQTALIESWFQSTVRGLAPVPATPSKDKQEKSFEGNRESIEGTTTQPVQMHQGGTTAVTWRLENTGGGVQLTVTEAGKSFTTPLPGATHAQFSFIDAEGKVHDQWPPKLGLQEDLPVIIALTVELDSGRTQQWAAAIVGPREPYYSPFEVEVQ